MHWISLIGFFIVINFCQAQPTTFQRFESGDNHVGMPESKKDVGNWVSASTNNVPLGNPVTDGRHILKSAVSSGNNKQCYVILPFITVVLMTMIRF